MPSNAGLRCPNNPGSLGPSTRANRHVLRGNSRGSVRFEPTAFVDGDGSDESALHPQGERRLAGVSPGVVGRLQVGERELGQVGGQLAAHPAGDVGAATHHIVA